jgi:hypothetical protein
MRQKLLVPIAVVLLVLLGLWGQYLVSPEKLSSGFSTSVYQIMMLFILDGEWTMELERVPLQLEFVRFFAPLVLFGSLLLVFAETARVSLTNYFVRFYTGHTIIIGLSEKSWQFLQTCTNIKDVVVIELSTENRLVGRARQLGVKVLIGDVFDERTFKLLNLRQASRLVIFTGNDGRNVELAIKVRNYIRNYTKENSGVGQHLKMHIHLDEIGLANQLENYPKFFADYSITEISFFSVYDLSARLLLRNYPPELFADVAGQERVHLCIYGFSHLAEKLVIEAALLCHYAHGSRLRLTILDDQAEKTKFRLESEYPHLSQICDYEFIQLSVFGPHIFRGELAALLPSVTQHIVSADTDEANLHHALMLRAALLEKRSSNAPILVRMKQSGGLAQLLESNTGEPEIPDGLYPFGMLDEVLHQDNVLTSNLDALAHSIHEMYLKSHTGGDPSKHKALQQWEDLPQWERKQNLLEADHWPVKLRAIRCSMQATPTEVPSLSAAEAELQAEIEHSRYVSQKLFDGWRYGEERLEDARINPYLVAWNELPRGQRETEVREALTHPAYLAGTSDRYMQRNFVIGVTGHRPNKMKEGNDCLRANIIEALEGLRADNPRHHFIVLSPLAEGADRMVAKLAMEVLNASLQVPLPLPYDLYVSDFSSVESVEEFKQLVGKAEYYYEMPMRFGNVRELASRPDNEARNQQYALAGAYIAQRCDRLIAIYDGQLEQGTDATGGTGQIVHWYGGGDMDSDYLFPHYYFTPPRREPAIILDPNAT